jgi:hypothetical protein
MKLIVRIAIYFLVSLLVTALWVSPHPRHYLENESEEFKIDGIVISGSANITDQAELLFTVYKMKHTLSVYLNFTSNPDFQINLNKLGINATVHGESLYLVSDNFTVGGNGQVVYVFDFPDLYEYEFSGNFLLTYEIIANNNKGT